MIVKLLLYRYLLLRKQKQGRHLRGLGAVSRKKKTDIKRKKEKKKKREKKEEKKRKKGTMRLRNDIVVRGRLT